MDFQTVIVGTGFSAQIIAINLLKQGLTNFVMLERRSFAGGTWLQNRYPGAAVDVHSPLYSLSGHPYPWSQMFAEQPELAQYTQSIFKQHQLEQHIKLNTEVSQAHWNNDEKRWHLLANNQPLSCQFLINATGVLSQPFMPDITGIEQLSIPYFHTNQWPDTAELEGKRVAIIGNGASATQVIPAIVDQVATLNVFQRSPHWVIPRPDMKFSPWFKRLLQRKWCYNTVRFFLYWAMELRLIGFKYSKFMLKLLAGIPAERHLKKHIKDDRLRKKLTPDFTIGCKRIILSNTYYPALSQAHVELHDKHDGISHFDQNTIVTEQGNSIDIDIVIFATGFTATDNNIPYPITGKNKLTLAQAWQDYPKAYLGTTVANFPNLFLMGGPNTAVGHTSALVIMEAQAQYVTKAMKQVLSSDKSSIDVTATAQDKYTAMIHREMESTVWKTGGCNSWYQSNDGKITALFPGFTFNFKRMANKVAPMDHVLE